MRPRCLTMPDGSNSTPLEERSHFWGDFFRLVSGCLFSFFLLRWKQEGRREGKQKNLPKKMSSHIEKVHMKKPLKRKMRFFFRVKRDAF